MAMAGIGCRVKVKGRSSATARVEDRPGRAPTSTPMMTPAKIRKRL
jgi:hypothetical protein